ncbi:putative transmembrane protein [Gregarina niphandrodes]|uniref:Transmembrane protein n=1 Tax=Gregarina niphandrodes TaxID=110365 RepID=A0A023B977_GRENI|nr:putative transmembrane protein [Gregarina niphandrodes]EZG71762.1 putative transmembrane protein [Gregarina niphandrodes]|eukprot:XP_011129809.1 putative transmembrane protein [Gregarina niphandrodes]
MYIMSVYLYRLMSVYLYRLMSVYLYRLMSVYLYRLMSVYLYRLMSVYLYRLMSVYLYRLMSVYLYRLMSVYLYRLMSMALVVVVIKADEDLLKLKNLKIDWNKIGIIAAYDIDRRLNPDLPLSTPEEKVNFSETVITPASILETCVNKLYCDMKLGYKGCFYGALFKRTTGTLTDNVVISVQDKFGENPPVVFLDTEYAKGKGSFKSSVLMESCLRTPFPLGNLSWRSFGGQGLWSWWLHRPDGLRDQTALKDALEFAFRTTVVVQEEGDRYECDWCEKIFYYKDDPIRKFDHTYCSLDCVTAHRKTNWKGITIRNPS